MDKQYSTVGHLFKVKFFYDVLCCRQKKNASNHSALKGIKVNLADINSEVYEK